MCWPLTLSEVLLYPGCTYGVRAVLQIKKTVPLRYSVLTLSVPAQYMYSAASHTSLPDGVLVLRDFHKVVK
jgi:hypothetical protein